MKRASNNECEEVINGQKGSIAITAIGALAAITAFAVAVSYGVTSNIGQSTRDRSVKRAIGAAGAGAQEAAYRMNMLQPTSNTPCVIEDAGTLKLAVANGPSSWCEGQSVDVGNGATATYWISPYIAVDGVVTRKIVSMSDVGGVSRRIESTVSTNTGTKLFGEFALESDQQLTMSGNAYVTGAVRSNDHIKMSGNAKVCGTGAMAIPGPGKQVQLSGNAEVCGPTDAAALPFTQTPVDQGDAPTNNDDGRFFTEDPKTGTVNWSPVTRQLGMSGNSTLILGGHTYSFCKLTMSGNSHLTIKSGAEVRIFIDSTSNCGLPDTTKQLKLSGNAKITNTDQDPTHLQIYMVGGTESTMNAAQLSGNATVTEMVFYAPQTSLQISGNGSYTGATVARRITMSGNAKVTYDSGVTGIGESTTGVYRSQKFVECKSGIWQTAPDDDC